MMASETSVFEVTFRQYRDQLGRMETAPLAARLGVQVDGDEVRVPLLGTLYRVSPGGVYDPAGEAPGFDVCVVLLKYLLRCPETAPVARDWVSYRGLKDSGPLTVYFANEVEGAIAAAFSGRAAALAAAGAVLGGRAPDIDARYDLALQFNALPRVPLCLLFNDADDEFPAACSLLFERRAEVYLDPECLAMLGRHLFVRLKRAAPG
jgi:hypothetical protein